MKKILIALMVTAFCMSAISTGMAGEKHKGRTVYHSTKWSQTEIGDEEGHIIAHNESKGIHTNFDGKWFRNGWLISEFGLADVNFKTGFGSAHGYSVDTDKDGNKLYMKWECKVEEGVWKCKQTLIKGTGKFEGIQGKGPASCYILSPDQWYVDWELEVELP